MQLGEFASYEREEYIFSLATTVTLAQSQDDTHSHHRDGQPLPVGGGRRSDLGLGGLNYLSFKPCLVPNFFCTVAFSFVYDKYCLIMD